MKAGIKCEIHDCTIELCKFLEKKGLFPDCFSGKLEKDKSLRIENQYYLRNIEIKINYSELLSLFIEFKSFLNTLNQEKIKEIRKIVEEC